MNVTHEVTQSSYIEQKPEFHYSVKGAWCDFGKTLVLSNAQFQFLCRSIG